MKEFHDTICKLFYYFKQAPACVARFVNIQRILESPELKIREVHGVRWLSFYEALEVVFRTLDPLLTYLQENKDEKAIGLRKKMTTTKFISLCYLVMDVIPVVTKLSQFFQKQNIDIAQLEVKLSCAIGELEMLKDSQGDVGHYHQLLQSDLTKCYLAADAPEWERQSGWCFKGHRIVVCPQAHIQGAQTAFIKNLISNIERRFPDSALMTAFGIFAMRPISLLYDEDLIGWGAEKLEQLLNHFGHPKTHTWREGDDLKSKTYDPVVDAEAARREWGLAKTTALSQDYPPGEIGPLWALMAAHHRQDFPILIKLAALALCCPVQIADCERGFSAQNRILTALRNRLNPLTQNKLLSVKLSKAAPENALGAWKAAKPRVVLASSSRKRQASPDSSN